MPVARRLTLCDDVREYPVLYIEEEADGTLPEEFAVLGLPEYADLRRLCVETTKLNVTLALDGWAQPLLSALNRYTPAQCLERVPEDLIPCQLMKSCNLYNPLCHRLRDLACPVYEPSARKPEDAEGVAAIIGAWRDGKYIVLAKR